MKIKNTITGKVYTDCRLFENSSRERCFEGKDEAGFPVQGVFDFFEVVQDVKSIDWEQRRYEIAKEVVVGLASYKGANIGLDPGVAAGIAVDVADALIEQLKKTIEND